MITFNPITTSHPHYAFVENLLHSAFPQEERRDNEFQRENTDNNPKFECLCITDQETDSVIGLITVWSLNGFRYIEHLATSPHIRNKGYGLKIMNKLKETYPGVIILEVERPEDEMSTRRIGFYKRCGYWVLDGHRYLDAGIWHQDMARIVNSVSVEDSSGRTA